MVKKSSKKRLKSKPKVVTAKKGKNIKAPSLKTTGKKPSKAVALRKFDAGQMSLPGVLSWVGYDLPAKMAYQPMSQVLIKLVQIRDASSWWLGDMLNRGKADHGEMWAQAVGDSRISKKTHDMHSYVSARVPRENRIGPSWTHHREVAKLDHERQKYWMKWATENDATVEELIEVLIEAGERKKGSNTQVSATHICIICDEEPGQDHICLGCEGLVQDAKENKLSKPQKSLLAFAFKYICEPDDLDKAAKKAWDRQFARLQKAAKAGEPEDAEMAA